MTDELEIRKTRKCPFYGFILRGDGMHDTEGNACALGDGSHTPGPCIRTDHCGNWDKCQTYNYSGYQAIIAKMQKSVKVFPKELFGPKRVGIDLKKWRRMVNLNQR